MSQESYQQALDDLQAAGQLRRIREVEPDGLPHCVVEGQPAIHFSSNDYLGLSRDPRLAEAAIEAIGRYGTGTGSSRLIAGTNRLVMRLEETLAAFKGTEAALVFNSGYQANVAILQAVLQPGDYVFCDRLNHASLMDGVLLSGAKWTRYRHLDLRHLEEKLAKTPRETRKWIVTDSVFSMDGDYPDLKAVADLAEQYGAMTLVDEAHATGLYGERKRSGLCETFGVSDRITLQMGTFSKALGGAGAYVAGSRVMIDTMINKARGLIYSTAMPPASMAAALKAVEIVQTDASLRDRLWENIRHFALACAERGVEIPTLKSPIAPVLVGGSAVALAHGQALLEAGYFVQAIRPPTVPANTARLRVTITAVHKPEHLDGLAERLAALKPAESAAGR